MTPAEERQAAPVSDGCPRNYAETFDKALKRKREAAGWKNAR
jgi:hypothetical protein